MDESAPDICAVFLTEQFIPQLAGVHEYDVYPWCSPLTKKREKKLSMDHKKTGCLSNTSASVSMNKTNQHSGYAELQDMKSNLNQQPELHVSNNDLGCIGKRGDAE